MRVTVGSALVVTLMLAGVARADSEPVPLSELSLFHDGKGHYLALRQSRSIKVDGKFESISTAAYMGDGRLFYRFNASGPTTQPPPGIFQLEFEDLRFQPPDSTYPSGPRQHTIAGDRDKVTLRCGAVERTFVPVAEASRKRILARAKQKEQFPERRPYRLARDDDGTYYYVNAYHDIYARRFDKRLLIGRRGKLKEVPLRDVVIDIAGELYVSKRGTLKYVYSKDRKQVDQVLWIAKGKPAIQLTDVELQYRSTRIFIYNDLGAYLGKKIGKPCDWL